uniref:RING-type domain-containing protein n=1 Tax=Odontella aurita TaxID=265563 RepID=A0A7S4MB64_9STRA
MRCPLCGNDLLGGRIETSDESGTRMTNASSSGACPSLPTGGANNRVSQDFALSNSNEAVEKLFKSASKMHNVRALRQRWVCPDRDFQHPVDSTECEICERPEQVQGTNLSEKMREQATISDINESTNADVCLAVDDAIESVRCPVCLELFTSPATLPCGHSLCLRHVQRDMRSRSCPVCRAFFTAEQKVELTRNSSLCHNVRAIVMLASRLEDPERDVIREARCKLGIGR